MDVLENPFRSGFSIKVYAFVVIIIAFKFSPVTPKWATSIVHEA